MKKNVTFEEAMLSLDNAVSRLESGSISLDEALATFEEAVKLIKICNEKINSAEQKVKMLIENTDGTVSDAPFDTE